MAKKETSRMRRVSDLIRVELAEILQKEASDARFNLITILDVTVSPDFSHARVYVSMLQDEKAKEIIAALNKAASYFRFNLAQRMDLRVMPALKFIYDDTTLRGSHITSLIDKALKEKKS